MRGIDPKSWFVFIWAAAFSGAAILLRLSRDLLTQDRVTSRDLMVAVIDAMTVVFFGGLFGWAMALLFPNVTAEFPTILAIGAALVSYSGRMASQNALYRLFARITGLPLRREEDTSADEPSKKTR